MFDSLADDMALHGEAESMGSKRAFTLIEMLVVIAIVGILAAIAFPKFSMAKEKATVARMMSDLRNLQQSQEAYMNEHQNYYGGSLPNPALVYAPSEGIVVTIQEATSSGWSATSGSALTSHICAVYMGNAAPLPPATSDSRVTCTR